MHWNARTRAIEHQSFTLTRGELLGIFAFWTFLALLSSANQLLSSRFGPLQPVLPAAPVALAFAQAYVWAALTPVIFWLANRFVNGVESPGTRAALLILMGFVIAIAVHLLIASLRLYVLFEPRAGARRIPEGGIFLGLRRMWFIGELTVYAAVLAAGFAREYFLRYQSRRSEAIRLQAQLSEARLATLQSQLNPHFLFNTLNAVSALVERDPRGVRRMIARLSELLRQTLDTSTAAEVRLSDEVRFAERYLEIMQIRFPDEFAVRFDIADDVRDACVPSLLLQPLVENAVRHGGIETSGTGEIEISAAREEDALVVRVADRGPGPGGSSVRGGGTGLHNTRERLQALYGMNQTLQLLDREGGGTVAEVRIPYAACADRR